MPQPDEQFLADFAKNPDQFRGSPEPLPELYLPANTPPALEKLGPSPFPKSKFPFLGFLASVYDHVAAHAKTRGDSDGATEPQS